MVNLFINIAISQGIRKGNVMKWNQWVGEKMLGRCKNEDNFSKERFLCDMTLS